jgi:lysophospholipase L1-like esterase
MICKNFEIHNVAELYGTDGGSVSWKRFPSSVHSALESSNPDNVVLGSTGVELRFVIKGESATVRMSTLVDNPKSFSTFHVYRGGIQGGWDDHEVHRHVTGEVQDFVIKRSSNIETLKEMSSRLGYEWDPEVVRIIFDRGKFKIYDIIGDVVPPSPEQCPKKTLLAYGSSITHGSNSIDASHSWVSVLSHNLKVDARNLGMAGSCMLEPEMAEYIASEGEKGRWDLATLELGINVLSWNDEKITDRVTNLLRQIAGRNQDKPIFVISPFYHCRDDFDKEKHVCSERWRKRVGEIVAELNYPNVTYINGIDVLGDMSYMSADEIHPNIYGVQRIADVLTDKIRATLDDQKI